MLSAEEARAISSRSVLEQKIRKAAEAGHFSVVLTANDIESGHRDRNKLLAGGYVCSKLRQKQDEAMDLGRGMVYYVFQVSWDIPSTI